MGTYAIDRILEVDVLFQKDALYNYISSVNTRNRIKAKVILLI